MHRKESHTMLQYETYRPAASDSWGSDPLTTPAPRVQTTRQRQQQTSGQKPRRGKTLVLVSAVIAVLAVVIFVVVGIIMKTAASSSNDYIDPPERLLADLPPELSDSVTSCYTSDAVLGIFQLTGEVPSCLVQKTPDGALEDVVYYLQTPEQVTAATTPRDYSKSRDLSDQAPHSEKLIMHFVGQSSIYVVNAVTNDRAFILATTDSTEEEVLEELARYGIIDKPAQVPNDATDPHATEALAS